MIKTLKISIAISFALSIIAILVLNAYIRDLLFDSSLAPWLGRMLSGMQHLGLVTSSRLFPCRKEGFDIGCESFKVVPTIILTNGFICTLFVIPLVHLGRVLRQGLREKEQNGTI